MEIVEGVITKVDPSGMTVWVPYSNIDRASTRQYLEVQVGLPDGRKISPEQRRKAYALMGEIAEAVGYTKDEIKDVMKHDFVANHLEQLEKELFSLANCDMTTAREYINYLIDFILRHDIPTHVPLQELADDIDKYVYACLIRKKCVICQAKADFHHVDTVGMGNNRNKVDHIGRECLPLCRMHHTEIHSIGNNAFFDRYHIRPGICDEKMVIIYHLRSKKGEVE